MAKDPAVLLYTDDFIAGTFTMSNAQVGAYIRLLCLQHQQGHLTEEKMISICKKRDPVIWSKFSNDEAGLYYNKRMETESRKRMEFSQKQSDRAAKRWDKQREPNLESDTTGYATALPGECLLGNGNGNRNTNVNKSSVLDDENTSARDGPFQFKPNVQKAVAAYMDKFGSQPPPLVIEGIKTFASFMEADAIIRAFDVALAEGHRQWSYIKGILSRYESDGVKTLADVLRLEVEHQEQKQTKGGTNGQTISKASRGDSTKKRDLPGVTKL
jgi:DnaD/phage-associated family protein